MFRCMTVVVSCLFLAIGSVCGDIVLVDEGNPTAAVVLGEQPTAMEERAASELARYVEQMSGAKLAVYSGLQSIAVLPENVVLIGRANDSTLVLTDDYASTRHARISLQDGMWLVEDLGSTNGTYLGHRKLDGPVPMEVGVPLRIGKTVLELR